METTKNTTGDALGVLLAVAKDYHDDPQFRAQLEESPRATLGARGVALPATGDVRVVADTKDVCHMVLPSDPSALMTDDALDAVAGGVGCLFCFGARW